jgi:uncharacterized protein
MAAQAAVPGWPAQGLINPCLGPLPLELAQHPLVLSAWQGLDAQQVWDAHVHVLGAEGSEAGFNTGALWQRGWRMLQRRAFLNAACSPADESLDTGYEQRLMALTQALPPGVRLMLLALDKAHDAQGRADDPHTTFWVANDACARWVSRHPERLEWAASVHPARADALAELDRVQALGARAVKWIPSAQGIDPASPRWDAYYAALVRLRLPLITHAGAERALSGEDEWGNPLRLRRALDAGVRIVVAHCASMGTARDLDQGPLGPQRPAFELFERLMAQPQYQNRLWGDLSAVAQSARALPWGARLLQHVCEGGDWAGRVLNGSDYPVPGLMPLYDPAALAERGWLDVAAVAPLTAIRRHNALLFDFVLKRQLRLGTRKLPAAAFETRRFFAATP